MEWLMVDILLTEIIDGGMFGVSDGWQGESMIYGCMADWNDGWSDTWTDNL